MNTLHPIDSSLLLDGFPLFRVRSVQEASECIGRVFSPHRLELRGSGDGFDAHHNQLRMNDVSLNVLSYGADVLIDASQRGDFYMVQLPLSGGARLSCDAGQVLGDTETLTVLQPGVRSSMLWSRDCAMVLVQVPRWVVEQRALQWGLGQRPRFALSRSRQDPAVAGWWQATLDLTSNLDRFGREWLRHPAAYAAMEEFLLSAFTSMLSEPVDAALPLRGEDRCLRRAKEYIRAHLDQALTLPELARHACVSPRTLEAVFKRCEQLSPLAYARRERLHAVHELLVMAAREGSGVNVTEVAMRHGFCHMGRFAAQYRERFGCSPSQTLRRPDRLAG